MSKEAAKLEMVSPCADCAASRCVASAADKAGRGLYRARCAQYKTQLRNLREKVEEDIEVVKRREVRSWCCTKHLNWSHEHVLVLQSERKHAVLLHPALVSIMLNTRSSFAGRGRKIPWVSQNGAEGSPQQSALRAACTHTASCTLLLAAACRGWSGSVWTRRLCA